MTKLPTERPKPTVRLSGGLPNVPKGEVALEPVNAWGRAMPKPERPPRPHLYQVHVKDSHFGKVIPVGPKMEHQYAEYFRLTIAEAVREGKDKRWSEPHLVCML